MPDLNPLDGIRERSAADGGTYSDPVSHGANMLMAAVTCRRLVPGWRRPISMEDT
jgi:hypothetical protein